MELITLKAKTRSETGKNVARRTRAAGNIPAVLYGGAKGGAVALTVNIKELGLLLQESGAHAVVQLDVEDNPALNSPTMVKSLQRHPMREHIVHADFMRINLDEKIQTSVPLKLVGRTKGVTDGGLLEQMLRDVEIECLALEVPDAIEVDTTELGIGDSIHVAQITPPAGVTILTEGDRTIAAVHTPKVVSTATEQVEGEEGEQAAEEEKKDE